MGGRFEGGDLAPLFVDAPSGSSVPGQAQICSRNRREQGATTHFSKVRFSAIQRTISESEGCSQVANNLGQNIPTMGCLVDGQLYNKQFTTNPNKNDKSLNATALAVLLLRDAPRYWHGHPNLEDLERRVPIVARMLANTEGARR